MMPSMITLYRMAVDALRDLETPVRDDLVSWTVAAIASHPSRADNTTAFLVGRILKAYEIRKGQERAGLAVES